MLSESLPVVGSMNIVGIYYTAEDALEKIVQHNPDVILMDLHLPNMSGIECTRRILEILPDAKIMILTADIESDTVFQALMAGALGYIIKSERITELASAISFLHEGGSPMTPLIAAKVVEKLQKAKKKPARQEDELTERENTILTLLRKEFSYRNIAEQLYISELTLKTHLQHIFMKLHVHSREEAIQMAEHNANNITQ